MLKLSGTMLSALLLVPVVGGCSKTTSSVLTEPHLQKVAEEVLDLRLAELKSMTNQEIAVMGAVVAIEPHTRQVIVMTSDRYARAKGINRASIRREVGSAFKPIIAAAALRSGLYNPDHTDVRICPWEVLPEPKGISWIPKNHNPVESRKISLRQALQYSYSTPSIMIASCISPERLLSTAKSLGIQSELRPVVSTAYGAGLVTLLELTNAYATFASGGVYQEPILSRKSQHTPSKRILSEKEAEVITSMLQGTVAPTSSASSDYRYSFAVKQGSTPHGRDGWCIGFTTDSMQRVAGLVIGVWVGTDAETLDRKKGMTMTHAARNIWSDLASKLNRKWISKSSKEN